MKNLLSAIRFMTVMPLGRPGVHDPKAMVPYFPIVGLLLGGMTAAFDHLALRMWSTPVASLLDVLFLVLLTGAFHLDGLGDTADGLLGHRPGEKVLAIMKDSRIGVMGLTAVICGLSLKFAGIASLASDRGLLLVIIPAYARAGMIFGIRYLSYGRSEEGIGYAFFGASLKYSAFAGCLLPVFFSLFLGVKAIWLNACFATLLLILLGYYKKRLGCITGDMLGALTEALEALLFLLVSIRGMQ